MPYVGTVVNGIVNGGSVKTGDAVLIGPDSNGNFTTTAVRSMQRKRFVNQVALLSAPTSCIIRAPVSTAEAGQCVSIALKRVRRDDVRKGMVLVHKTDVPPRGCLSSSGS